jgi:glycosyltransferase involved in cell wall biosynthesis
MRCDWEIASRDFLMAHAARGDPRAAEILRGLLLSERPAEERAEGVTCRVAVGVCTAVRAQMLAHCLDAIGGQMVPASVEVHVVVVDNEAEPRSEGLVRAFAARCPFPVHYIHEPRRGIPQARNAVLDSCRRLGADWIAFTDDDCWVSPLWLESLLEAARRHNADAVYGRREFVFPLPSPFWAMAPDQGRYMEGQTLPYAATHNVLFAAWLIDDGPPAGLRFDETLAHGEDTDYFHRAACLGARIVYSHAPVVYETVSPERSTLSYQARRAYYYAASRSSFHRRYKGISGAALKLAVRWLFQAPVAVARLTAAPFVLPFSGPVFRGLVLKGAARLAGAAGCAAGLLGFEGNPYQTIDGY